MNFTNLEEVINFAIEKEQEAAQFYRDASNMESFSGAREMLADFAKEEDKHAALLNDFKNNTIDQSIRHYKFKWIPDIKRSDYVDEVEHTPGMTYKDMLMMAMKREEKALALYNMMLKNTEQEDAKKLLKVLCQEEAKHKLGLETMYDDYMAEMGD